MSKLSATESLALMESGSASWKDYYELTKPKVVLVLMLTAVIGMFLATPGWVPMDILIFGSLGMAMAMAASAVVNHVMDQRIDAVMARTQNRPIATGKIDGKKALLFAFILAALSMVILELLVNRLTALLTFAGIIGYAFFYTMFLKRATPQNIVIGGLAGAIPPLLGWTAVTNEIHPHALILVLIIFVWTPPHFWALAVHRRDDYARAEIPMLPVTHGIDFTKTSIVLYTILLITATVLPYPTGMSGIVYLIGALILGSWFLAYTLKLKFRPAEDTAIRTFGVSIFYLVLLFSLLLADHYIPYHRFS